MKQTVTANFAIPGLLVGLKCKVCLKADAKRKAKRSLIENGFVLWGA